MTFPGRISVIIPAFQEEDWITGAVDSLGPAGDVEVLVVDGGSRDATVTKARSAGALVIRSARGRGVQMNAGAARATGDLLVFLHADARLSRGALPVVRAAFADPALEIATFRRRFDRGGFRLGACAALSRIDSLWTRFGDQGIVLRRSFFDSLGRFPDWRLLEDVHLLRAARRRTRCPVLPATITVSTRRFDRTGVVRGQLLNARFLLRYLRGAPPEEIAVAYERMGQDGVRGKSGETRALSGTKIS